MGDENWKRYAACLGEDPDLFFPPRGNIPPAGKMICARCPVRQDCLDYAVENGILHGIWGGKSERERRGLRRAYLRQQGVGRDIAS